MAKPRNKQTDTFARLLATENIKIVRGIGDTATFDTESRTLTMPMMAEDMPKSVSNMLMSHEVGHALYTPAKAVVDSLTSSIGGTDNPRTMEVLNVIEDARIEKLIKREYPGLKADYYNGWGHMVDAGLFNLPGKDVKTDIAEYGFMDRANIHFKCGSIIDVPFSPAEQVVVDAIAKCETFEDVADIAKKLLDPSDQDQQDQQESGDGEADRGDKQNQENKSGSQSGKQDNKTNDGESDDGDDAGDGDSDSGDSGDDADSGDSGDSGESGDGDSDSGDSGESDESDSGDADGSESDVTNGSQSSNTPGSLGQAAASIDMNSGKETVGDAAQKATAQFATGSQFGSIDAYEIESDKRNIKNCVLPYESYLDLVKQDAARLSSNKWNKYNKQIKPLVSAMAQSFNRHKKADEYRKTSMAKTGVIDTNRLSQYKFTEDVFKRNALVPKGKKHGMVMVVDFSGSMSHILHDTLKQVIMLARFCKAIRVPYTVYSFTCGRYNNVGGSIRAPKSPANNDGVIMVELLSSRMKMAEFDAASRALFFATDDTYSSTLFRDRGPLRLGGTPLCASIEVTNAIIEKFKADQRIDMVTGVILTDGGEGGNAHHNGYGHTFVSTTSKKTGKIYDGIPYCNALVQDIRAAHNATMINMHISDYLNLPMGSDNETGEHRNIDQEKICAHNKNSISSEYNVGGFNSAHVIGTKAMHNPQRGKAFVKEIAKTFATNGKV